MPEGRRWEWYEQIKNREVPKFERGAVISTLKDMLLNRDRFLAERVDGIFKALSKEHVTNQPQGFSKRMILYVYDNLGLTTHKNVGHVNDLRAVISKFMERDEPKYTSTGDILDI